jgi:hypothetical protein
LAIIIGGKWHEDAMRIFEFLRAELVFYPRRWLRFRFFDKKASFLLWVFVCLLQIRPESRVIFAIKILSNQADDKLLQRYTPRSLPNLIMLE